MNNLIWTIIVACSCVASFLTGYANGKMDGHDKGIKDLGFTEQGIK